MAVVVPLFSRALLLARSHSTCHSATSVVRPVVRVHFHLFMRFWMFHAILSAQKTSPKIFLHWAVGEARRDTMLPSILVSEYGSPEFLVNSKSCGNIDLLCVYLPAWSKFTKIKEFSWFTFSNLAGGTLYGWLNLLHRKVTKTISHQLHERIESVVFWKSQTSKTKSFFVVKERIKCNGTKIACDEKHYLSLSPGWWVVMAASCYHLWSADISLLFIIDPLVTRGGG